MAERQREIERADSREEGRGEGLQRTERETGRLQAPARSRRRRQARGDVEEEAGAARTGSGDGTRRQGRRGLR
jgi:hypothetical protein